VGHDEDAAEARARLCERQTREKTRTVPLHSPPYRVIVLLSDRPPQANTAPRCEENRRVRYRRNLT
jgi:hypothetical protein